MFYFDSDQSERESPLQTISKILSVIALSQSSPIL